MRQGRAGPQGGIGKGRSEKKARQTDAEDLPGYGGRRANTPRRARAQRWWVLESQLGVLRAADAAPSEASA